MTPIPARAAQGPSRSYVLVVISLAAFMLVLSFWQRPPVWYTARGRLALVLLGSRAVPAERATAPTGAAPAERTPADRLQSLLEDQRLWQQVLEEAYLLPQQNRRPRVIWQPTGPQQSRRLYELEVRLEQPSPERALRLTNRYLQRLVQRYEADGASDSPEVDWPKAHLVIQQPARLLGRRAASLPGLRILAMLAISLTIGAAASLLLTHRTAQATILTSLEQVRAISPVPVVAVLRTDGPHAPRRPHFRLPARRPALARVLRSGEFVIAASALLICYHMVASDGFATRALADPFAAYTEAVSVTLGSISL